MILSKGWKTCKFEEVARIIHGVTYKKENSSQTKNEGYVPIFRANNILNGKINCDELVYVPETLLSTEQWVNIGDIIIVMSSGSKTHVGKTAISTKDYQCGFGAFCAKIIVSNNLYNKYLAYYFCSTFFRRYIENICKGTNINNIKRDYILAHMIPLPPLAEQHRIVAKIEELFAELDRGIAGLEKAKAQLKTYRQAVLKGAFPTTCTYAPLGEYAEMCLGKMLDKSKNQGSLQPYLRNINVRWFSVDLSDILEMRFEDRDDERYNIVNGDLVICEGGEPGRCAIWKFDYPIKIQKALHRVRTNSSLNATYLMYYLRYLSHTNDITKYFTGTTIKHLTGQSLKKIRIPIVDINKQQQIVSAIESRLSISDSLEKTIDSSLKNADLLRMSILKKAFAGELVGQDPADAPSLILSKENT